MTASKYKAVISYDGTHYFGWEKTQIGPSIQETIQSALTQVTREETIPDGASRTDRGVHAVGQVISIALKKQWEPKALIKSLNGVLPQDIRILSLELASPHFHPTLQAIEKEYHYSLCLGQSQNPIYRLYSWAFHLPLDVEKMKRASQDFLGERNFSAFANGKKCDINPFCTLKWIQISPLPENRLQIAICGNRFLYKMARNIAGALVYIGCGKFSQDCIPNILTSKDRRQAGITAPAHGLALYRVAYSGVPSPS